MGRETSYDLAPDVGREWTAVQEQQGLAIPLLVVGDAGLTDVEDVLLLGETISPHRGTSRAAFTVRQPPRLLQQAHPEVQKAGHARVGDPVEEPAPLTPGCDDSPIREALELVGDRLRLHPLLGS